MIKWLKELISFKKNRKQWLYLGFGVLLLVLSFWLASIWTDQRENLLLTLGVILGIPGGIFLIYKGARRPDHEAVIVGHDKPSSEVNSLNIYARKNQDTGKIYAEKIAFEWINKPLGQPQQCTNNSKWYHVHIFDISKQLLLPFTLPDNQYFDPREFANVINMPSHRKLFARRISLIQKVAPWIMVIAFIISTIGVIATMPPPGA